MNIMFKKYVSGIFHILFSLHSIKLFPKNRDAHRFLNKNGRNLYGNVLVYSLRIIHRVCAYRL